MTTERRAARLYRDARRAAWVGLLVNLTLGLVKLVAGLAGRSFALLSDAVNSLGDSVTSLVVLYGLHVAQRPADEEHPYGHTRAEAIAGSNVALLIILSAVYIGWQALLRIGHDHALPPAWTLLVAAANILIKEGLYQYKVRIGQKTGSSALIANAWDHRSDALCSLAVLIGLTLVRWGGPSLIWADEAAALVVALAIVWSGTQLFRKSASELMDPQADAELVERIERVASGVSGVRAIETLWVRKSGLEYFADMHIEVDQQITVEQGHRIGHAVKDRLLDEFPSLRDVLIHLEPYPHTHVAAESEARTPSDAR